MDQVKMLNNIKRLEQQTHCEKFHSKYVFKIKLANVHESICIIQISFFLLLFCKFIIDTIKII